VGYRESAIPTFILLPFRIAGKLRMKIAGNRSEKEKKGCRRPFGYEAQARYMWLCWAFLSSFRSPSVAKPWKVKGLDGWMAGRHARAVSPPWADKEREREK
jgi:hypothetical protein